MRRFAAIPAHPQKQYTRRWRLYHFCGFYYPIREVIPIAIYHWNIGIVSRGKGKSAVAAAAYGRNYQTYKPIQDEYRQIRWKGKQEKFAEARRAELTLWDAANRYLHAHLPEGVKTLPISAWEKEYTALKAQREAEYDTLKDTRAEVAELQKIRKCVDVALKAEQPEQTQTHTKRHDIDR